jgi:hypothetical protein
MRLLLHIVPAPTLVFESGDSFVLGDGDDI